MIAALFWLFVALILIGVLFWAAERILAVMPMAEPFKTIAYVVLVVIAVIIAIAALAQIFGIASPYFHLPTLR